MSEGQGELEIFEFGNHLLKQRLRSIGSKMSVQTSTVTSHLSHH